MRFPWAARSLNASDVGEYITILFRDSSIARHPPITPEREHGVNRNRQRITDDTHSDSERHLLLESTEKNQHPAHRRCQRRLREQTEQEEAGRSLVQPLDKPV